MAAVTSFAMKVTVPVALGVVAATGLLAMYLALITVAQGWQHAVAQLSEDRWFVTAILAGFGTQVGLFSYLRRLQARAGAAGMAASTGTSTTAMLACCAHHLADVLPLLGLSGAAIFLDLYKTQLLWLGILMNLIGIGYLILLVRRQSPSNEGISPARHSHSQVHTETMPSR